MTTSSEQPKNPNRAIIMKALGYTDWGYDNLIHQFFVSWCEEMAMRFYHMNRDLIANETLYSYYKNQWKLLVEQKMMNEYGGYLKNGVQGCEKIYYSYLYECATELENYYPASIICGMPKPKKHKIKYQFNYN